MPIHEQELEVKKVFSKYGTIRSVDSSNVFAFVKFFESKSVYNALDETKCVIERPNGSFWKVNISQSELAKIPKDSIKTGIPRAQAHTTTVFYTDNPEGEAITTHTTTMYDSTSRGYTYQTGGMGNTTMFAGMPPFSLNVPPPTLLTTPQLGRLLLLY